MTSWVVILEWSLGGGEPLEAGSPTIATLLDALADAEPIALCQPDRFALQLRLAAATPVAALTEALARFSTDIPREGLGSWELVRIELLTPEELESEWDALATDPVGQEALDSVSGRSCVDHVREAELALEKVTRPEEAQVVLSRLVRQLGGGVVAARVDDDWTLPVDVSFGAGAPGVAIAEPWSIARITLEQALPKLVDKARERLAGGAVPELSRSATDHCGGHRRRDHPRRSGG